MRVDYKFISATAMAYALFGGEFYYEQEVAGADPAFASNSPPTLANGIPFVLAAIFVYIVSTTLFARGRKTNWALSTYLHSAGAISLGILFGFLFYQLRSYISPAPVGLCAFCPGDLEEPPFVVRVLVFGLVAALAALPIGYIARYH